MKPALALLYDSIKALWDNAFLAAFCSLVWLFSVLLIVPGPPATVALYAIAGQLVAKEPLVDFSNYWRAIWKHFGLGWRWAATNIPVIGLLLIDIRTIPRFLPAEAAAAAQIFFYAALALWIILNWFGLAFLFQQKELSLRQAYRNAFILVIQQPFLTLSLAVLTAMLLWLSLLLVILNLLFGPMFISLAASKTVETQLAAFRESQTLKTTTE